MTSPRWPRFAAAGLGFVWFLQIGGGPGLNPRNVEWLWAGDWRQHWLGFLFFQHDPWTFPLGQLPSLLYPVGTNIGFTDSNPLLALLIKPFAGILPHEYQLIGLWLGLCFAMQGYMGAALASAVTKDSAQQMLGGYLIVLSPVLVARIGHDTLCAHWILIGLLYLGLRDSSDRQSARRTPWLTTGAVALAAAIHPYLAAMSWVLALAVLVRLWIDRGLSAWRALMWMALATVCLLGIWSAIGYFGKAPDGAHGFGMYSSDVLTLIDSANYSRLVPRFPTTPGQYEGVGFLGLGGLVAFVAALSTVVIRRPRVQRGVVPAIVACLLLGIYAISSSVKVAGSEILDLQSIYAPLTPLIKPFRASGRFIWPVHYLALAFGIWGIVRLFGSDRRQTTTAMLALVTALQAGDIKAESWKVMQHKETQILTEAFEPARGHYKHVALAPTQVLGACGNPYEEDYVYRVMLLAHRLGMTFNSGIYARLDVKKVSSLCEAQDRNIDQGILDPETIYIVSPPVVDRFTKSGGATCGQIDGNAVCVSRKSDARFQQLLDKGKAGQ